ncbi:VWA domain-containing protein [Thioflexithrix psekupsensis]|uniref:VWFA domain-containing protein n=1 Tax=Thioflexithrix psekupsensis TaxID=1570016 RepID=A0A251XCS6_9GAMM|nr:extracellular solute-binding protein [Thioflexithrix psekupsensis]OUD16242.1 hypothetical protein TPSD3_00525 [Thioflexithrix psekupsensis]
MELLSRFFTRVLILLFSLFLISCSGEDSAPQNVSSEPSVPTVELVFLYGSEKQAWLETVTQQFNQQQIKTEQGDVIYVKTVPMGSAETIDHILNETEKAHLISPASAAFIKLGNAESQVKLRRDVVSHTENLVLSPVVIAMWKPMAEALGWGEKNIGWQQIIELANDPKGWANHGHPEWGRFKFGHTHPEYSNSGLIALFAQIYASTGKLANLTLDDVHHEKTKLDLMAIQNSIVHYGRSTGFFGDKMAANGPGYLSAAVLYENMVIQSYEHPNRDAAMVAIYPEEGTFWSDHPVGIVERDWVTPMHRKAAQQYIQFLLAQPQQEQALRYGFRPADLNIPLTTPFNAQYGVDPKQPKTTLEIPSVEVMHAIMELWKANKKISNVVMVADISGSMSGDKIIGARSGLQQMLTLLNERDSFSLLIFNNELNWLRQSVNVGQERTLVFEQVGNLFATGGTALYDAINQAYSYLKTRANLGEISAIVVLSDGADSNSQLSLQELLQRLQFNSETQPIRVFTIGYGQDADEGILKAIAEKTQGKYYHGDPNNIRKVFTEISTFF